MRRRIDTSFSAGPVIPLTPLIDLVFLLLIYFMLASNFMETQQFKVNLPESSHGSRATGAGTILSLTSQGGFFLQNEPVQEGQLQARLKTEAAKTGSPELEIRADRDAPVHLLVAAMDAAKTAGFNKITLRTACSASTR